MNPDSYIDMNFCYRHKPTTNWIYQKLLLRAIITYAQLILEVEKAVFRALAQAPDKRAIVDF
jgi:hypothetical protein